MTSLNPIRQPRHAGHDHASPSHKSEAAQKEHDALMSLVPQSSATHVAVKSGSWFDPRTWQNSVVPGNDAQVLIPAGVRLQYNGQSDARIRTVRLDGILEFAPNKNTKMVVDTFVNAPEGTLVMGTAKRPILANRTARMVFTSDRPIDKSWDPKLMSRGLISHGEVKIQGADKLDFVALKGDARAGSNKLVLDLPEGMKVPQGWQVGDRLVLGGTSYTWGGSDADNSRFQDEVLIIQRIRGNQIRFVQADDPTGRKTLRFDHQRPAGPRKNELKLYVANTSRNVQFETENGKTAAIANRGHVMFMHNPSVQVQNAGFYHLGRADKSKLVDDPGTNVDGSPGRGTNRRGRYPLHFHHTGVDNAKSKPSIVQGNAVVDSPGWGIVHHASHALLEDNVVFDVGGAGIVAEAGNEIGVWRNNITIKSRGIPWQEVQKTAKDRDRLFDFGFRGEGYWVQGAAQVAMQNNIAISANDAGITVFGDTLDPKKDFREATTFSLKNLPKPLRRLIAPKGQTEVDVTDVPLRELTGFQSYNSNVGINLWARMTNFDGQLELSSPAPTTAHQARSRIDNFKVWNVRWNGVRVQYSSYVDIENGLISGNAKDPRGEGIFNNHAGFNNRFKNLWVSGFEQGMNQEFTDTDKDFLAPSIENSTFSRNTYTLSKIGQPVEKDDEGIARPDDFPSFFKIIDIKVKPGKGNAKPKARFQAQSEGGLAMEFDASASFDRDPLKPGETAGSDPLASKGIAAYGWDFNRDGAIDAFGRKVHHRFEQAGRQKVTLVVWDNQGVTHKQTKGLMVKPKAFVNPISDSDFNSSTPFLEGWQSNSQWSDEGWFATRDVTVTASREASAGGSAAVLSKPGVWGGAIGQVIQDNGIRQGKQTLSLDLKNLEGNLAQPWRYNEITLTFWGVNGQFKNSVWEEKGPQRSGTLPMQRKQLLEKTFGGEKGTPFDWKTLNYEVNLGKGYQFLLFQVNTTATLDEGDLVAIDNVSLTNRPAKSTKSIKGTVLRKAASLDSGADPKDALLQGGTGQNREMLVGQTAANDFGRSPSPQPVLTENSLVDSRVMPWIENSEAPLAIAFQDAFANPFQSSSPLDSMVVGSPFAGIGAISSP
ncbi:MAG: PKD domain-containing protein [Oculatellaceae cyanobacterium Prado106]|nr:PKD domain-containing protein [Oculatellaceae cyanobacterium Prado106]